MHPSSILDSLSTFLAVLPRCLLNTTVSPTIGRCLACSQPLLDERLVLFSLVQASCLRGLPVLRDLLVGSSKAVVFASLSVPCWG